MRESIDQVFCAACRIVSLGLAVPMVFLVINSDFMIPRDEHYRYGVLFQVVWGVCAALMHGFGFRFTSARLRMLISLLLTWPLLIISYLMFMTLRLGMAGL